MNDDFKNLLKLLDDDNDQSAAIAMAGLLRKPDRRLERVLRTLQETSDPKLRRRIHQLQSAMLRRRKRKLLAADLGKQSLSLYDGIVQLHLLWFDNDTLPEVNAQWNAFADSAGKHFRTFPDLLKYFGGKVPVCRAPGEPLTAENVCLGTILEDGEGADFMCCVLARLLGEHFGFTSGIVSSGVEFALLRENVLYFPCPEWHSVRGNAVQAPVRLWQDPELLSLLAQTLFYSAVATDGYRYIHTLGCCMAQRDDVTFLPYPYGKEHS